MRPAASGQYPLALISHGSPRNVDDRAGMTAHGYRAIAFEFARRGFAALVVLRRGYGTSPGGLIDSFGSCSHPDYRDALAVSVADLEAAIAAMQKRNDVTTRGMIAIGHSAGGLASVGLTAEAPPGLVAAINFAGGRGSARAGMVCGDKTLVDLFRQFGTTSRVPTLWVYASNDGFFPPELAHRFRDAFTGSGGKMTFVDAPAFGKAAIPVLESSAATWTPYVDNFLRAQNLLHQIAVDALPMPPQLGANASAPSRNTSVTRLIRRLQRLPTAHSAGDRICRRLRRPGARRWMPAPGMPRAATSTPSRRTLAAGTTGAFPGFPLMRIREENCNMVLLAMVALFTIAIAGIVGLIDPPPAPAQNQSAYLADQTPVRVVGGAPFVPNVNPSEHR